MAQGLEAVEMENSDGKELLSGKEPTHFEALEPPMCLFITCIFAEQWKL